MTRFARTALAGASSLALLTAGALAQDAPLIMPGAPGTDARELSGEEAVDVADTRYAPADVRFMQAMIPHHGQAVVMARMAPERTNDEDVLDIAGRILRGQEDEIAFMQTWLRDRDEDAPEPGDMHAMHAAHDMDGMEGMEGMSGTDAMPDTPGMAEMMKAMGMASAEQMEALAASEGTDFDRQFLSLMIPHHEGAVAMVEDLFGQPGSAYDPVLYEFANDVRADQTAEITRMDAMLGGLSEDARVGLAPGLRDAGEAASGIELVASLPKPRGFFDPENPGGLPVPLEPTDDAGRERGGADDGDAKTEYVERSPHLSFWNTDMAFTRDALIAGSYHGFNIYRLDEAGMPDLLSSVVCPGGQGDVSVVGDLLIMSVEQTRGRVDCGLQGVEDDVSEERFRGLRVFDISDMRRPRQVGQVQTCRGSHTHSVVSADDERIVVYNSGTSGVRDEEELAGCVVGMPGDEETALFSIDVIEIPVDRPEDAAITSSPRVFADDETGRVAGLWTGGDHGDGTQRTSRTDQCHDITVFPEAGLAAGACSGNGILLDISDPLQPKRIDAVTDEGFAYWHSATFNNDGTKVLFTDEWGGGVQPRCRASDPLTWGADAIYAIEDGELVFEGYYKMPAPQTDTENCVAHNGSVVPVPGRDVFAQAWYQGGLSVVDFTDGAAPVEIAYFDRGPIFEDRTVIGGYWSTYWHDGKIYGTEIVRGLDVLELQPSEHLTADEIAAAGLAVTPDVFNPQQQFSVTWPDHPVVARAYIDQLARAGRVDGDREAEMDAVLEEAEAAMEAGESDRKLARQVASLSRGVRVPRGDAVSRDRLAALRNQLGGIADALR